MHHPAHPAAQGGLMHEYGAFEPVKAKANRIRHEDYAPAWRPEYRAGANFIEEFAALPYAKNAA